MDLFGSALQDYHAGARGQMLTIRRDDGHVDTHDPGIYFAEEPFAHEVELLALAEGPVLDVGCGAGRTLLWLAKQGVEATGIDVSPGAAAVARARGCRDVRGTDVLAADYSVVPAAAFQTIILFGNNVGIGGTIDGAELMLRRLESATKAGGRLLVTGLDIAKTSAPHHLAYHQKNRDRGRPIGEIRMRFEYEGAVGAWVPWFHPEPPDMLTIAKNTGWRLERHMPAVGPFFGAVFRKVQ
ncbi:MAG: class I SAM-dependent methyltransferase [Pseudomonadota bacterium]